MSSLDQLRPGQHATVAELLGEPALTVRLMEMGVLVGEPVEFVGVAPLGDPMTFKIGGCRLALRKRDAAQVRVDTSAATIAG